MRTGLLVYTGYCMGVGYLAAKTGADKKIAAVVKHGYTELVRYTASLTEPVTVTVNLVGVDERPQIDKGDNDPAA